MAVAFMFTNHEIVFAILLAFIGVLFLALLWGALRPLVPVCLAGAGAGILLLAARRVLDWQPLPLIPWENPTSAQQSAYYRELLLNPFVIGVLLLGVLFVVGRSVSTLRFQAPWCGKQKCRDAEALQLYRSANRESFLAKLIDLGQVQGLE